MIEVYLFYPMFIAQIGILSVLFPRRLIARLSGMHAALPPQQSSRLHPWSASTIATGLRIYRWLNHLITLIGIALLAWLITYMQRPDWDDGPVETLVTLYFMIQMIPLMLCSWGIAHFNRLLRQTAVQEKRRASLKRRTLSDFVSPVAVAIAALLYPAFIVLVVVIQQNPFPGYAGYVNIVFITLLYGWTGLAIRWALHGRKANPYQSDAERMHDIETIVKISVYSCIAGVLFLSLNFSLAWLDLQNLEPLALSIFFVFCSVLYFRGLSAPRHLTTAD